MLGREQGNEAKGYPEGHAATEGEEKDAKNVEDRADVDFRAAELDEGPVHNASDRIM